MNSIFEKNFSPLSYSDVLIPEREKRHFSFFCTLLKIISLKYFYAFKTAGN